LFRLLSKKKKWFCLLTYWKKRKLNIFTSVH
jgi:hypothetical protein